MHRSRSLSCPMAKSSKKQCRKPKAPRQGGGLVVVSAQNLQAKPTKPAVVPPSSGKGKKKSKKKQNILDFDDPHLIISDDEDFDNNDSNRGSSGRTPPPHPGAEGVHKKRIFSSAHTREQRLYYLLTMRTQANGEGHEEGGCHAVVFVEAITVAQELIAELKALSLVAFAVHERTPKTQAQDHIQRFLSASSAERSSVLVLTNTALARSLSIRPIPTSKATLVRVVHYDAPEGRKNAAARERIAKGVFGGQGAGKAEEVHIESGEDAMGLTPFVFESAAFGVIRSRCAVAKKLARAVAMSAGEEQERGMQRAAAAAGLEWEDDDGMSESGADAVKREKKRAHAQQAAALREKLSVLLCQPLLPSTAKPTATNSTATSVQRPKQSSKELRKKMALLGMIRGPEGEARASGVKGGAAEDRAAAKTRWLDSSAGILFGGTWDGNTRSGASCDSASLDLRLKVEAAKQAAAAGGCSSIVTSADGSGQKRENDVMATKALAKWKPNPDTPDPERWGGRWGKPCGHNEVVLQQLRPFAPMEVVNTRVCSRASPAPGNTGFDGCLELLSLTCQAHERALTVWDDASFLHIDGTGVCSSLPKQTMLHLSLPKLRFLLKNMRSFTLCCDGQTPPQELARAVIRSVGWGAKQSKFGPLSAELSTRIMSFVLTGDSATWASISAGFGVGVVRQTASTSVPEGKQRDTVAFASKKKRKNFNL